MPETLLKSRAKGAGRPVLVELFLQPIVTREKVQMKKHSHRPHPHFSLCGSLLRINSLKHQIRRLRFSKEARDVGVVEYISLSCHVYTCVNTLRIFSVKSQLLKSSYVITSLFLTPSRKGSRLSMLLIL